MKKFIFLSFLVYSSLFGSGTYNGVFFTDYEENATIYLCNYYPFSHFLNLNLSSTEALNIVNNRPYTTMTEISNLVTTVDYLRADSHLVDWNTYTDQYGMTLTQTNFSYALMGNLIGFTFLFFFIFVIIKRV